MKRGWVAMPVVLGLAVLGVSGEESSRPRAVRTRFPTPDLPIAVAELGPVAAEEDACGRLQGVVDRVAGVGGGVVFLHAGVYPLRGPLVIREGVTLRGDRDAAGTAGTATVLAVDERAGETEGVETLCLERGSGIRGIHVWYPRQRLDAVIPYPWAVGTSEQKGGDNVTLVDVTLVNAYRGIRIGPEWNELHTLRNVSMTALDTGISADTTTDIGRLDGVRIGPEAWENSGLPGAPSPGSAALREYLLRSAVGLDIGRSDWEYIHGIRAHGLRVGVV
ncbi:MAG: hypothetical protein JXR77_15760, partial [Lentisphaeria bacterium]|nr:hypothetical protein [Lentisphaeria bacterium]